MKTVEQLKIKIFADGANKESMLAMYANPHVAGFTTNPTLMCKAGIKDFEHFARDIVAAIPDRSISFEVFSDDFDEMYLQALKISSWGENVYAKIPVTNTQGKPATALIKKLADKGVKQNVTAIMTLQQVQTVTDALAHGPSAYVSVFAGRIADTGRNPEPLMKSAREILRPYAQLELLWASSRELLNVFQADDLGCQIITVTDDIIKKLAIVGKNLDEYSLETVKMFYADAQKAGFKLSTDSTASM